jgi:hydrogenase-4 component F
MIYALGIPLLAAFVALASRNTRTGEYATVASSGLIALVSVLICRRVLSLGPIEGQWFRIDALSAYILLVISFLSLLVSFYSIGYMRNEVLRGEGIKKERTLRMYYFLFNLFVFTMALVPAANNLALLWITIEATTLVSAVLVGIYRRRESVEAAWKYIILCTVGITFALMGTFIFYYASTEILGKGGQAMGEEGGILTWTGLISIAKSLNPATVKLGLILIMVGYGTKAGLAPVHNWLPDAHSEAPTPISALLSGILLNCAFYGIMRFSAIAGAACGHDFVQKLMAFFGLSSLIIAAIFILIQTNAKRLLAYSSIEHMGFIGLSFGTGGALGIYASLLHVLNHALVKPLMFFVVGHLHSMYHTVETRSIKGVLKTSPLLGAVGFIGLLAITGMPPFNIFMSEFLILRNFALGGHWYILSIALVASVLVFYGFLKCFGGIFLGEGESKEVKGPVLSWRGGLLLSALCGAILFLGVYVPAPLERLLNLSSGILNGLLNG